jgi:hypothetical protein
MKGIKELIMKRTLVTLALTSLALLGAQQALAQDTRPELGCKLAFSLSGWSAVVSSAHGNGMVTCSDGSTLPVLITAKGGGLTAGRTHVDDGKGDFTHVHTIDEVLGRYAQGEAHAGLAKSGTAQVLTKGTVSLALAGHGEGIDLGVDVGEFTLKAAQ